MKKLMLSVLSITILVIVTYFLAPPLNVEKYFGPVEPDKQSINVTSSPHGQGKLFIADMHADTLLWKRSIAEKSNLGHADLFRLLDANVGLQVFMSVIEAPNDVESDSIHPEGDQITSIALLDKWPAKTLMSYKERALYQASRLFKAAHDSAGKMTVVLSQEDLSVGIEAWQSHKEPLMAILGLEGAHATEFKLENLDTLFNAGFRSMELAHYSDTDFAGSSSGMEKHGLTDKGIALVRKMNSVGMIIDVAHLSNRAIEDVLDLTARPVYSSHTGVYATCPKARNLPDNLIKRIAQSGGIIGIGFFEGAICEKSLDAIVRAIKHVSDLVGAEYVALGSGWDIAPLAITPKELPDLTHALLAKGFSEDEVSEVMGKNVTRFFLKNLPADVKKRI
jgi:membrane dipeptidase